jgi:ankyrin repeat protein
MIGTPSKFGLRILTENRLTHSQNSHIMSRLARFRPGWVYSTLCFEVTCENVTVNCIRRKLGDGVDIISPLHFVAQDGNTSELERLVCEFNADVECRSANCEETIAHKAAGSGHLATILWCESKNIDTHLPNIGNSTPLILAADVGADEIVRHLLANVSPLERMLLHDARQVACEKGHSVTFELLHAHIQNLPKNRFVPTRRCMLLHRAANAGRVQLCRYIADVVAKDLGTSVAELHEADQRTHCSPIHLAAMSGSVDCVRLFVCEHGIDVHTAGLIEDRLNTALSLACRYGHVPLVRCLLEELKCDPLEIQHGYSYSHDSRVALKQPASLLQCAVRSSNVRLMQYLLAHHSQVCGSLDDIDEQGRSLLCIAAQENSVPMCRYLIDECKLDPHKDMFDPDGTKSQSVDGYFSRLPLGYAIGSGSIKCVQFFMLEQKCDLTHLLASEHNFGAVFANMPLDASGVECIRFMLTTNRAAFLTVNNCQNRALQQAISCRGFLLAVYLIMFGAYDPSPVMPRRRSATVAVTMESDASDAIPLVEACRVAGRHELVRLLLAYGAPIDDVVQTAPAYRYGGGFTTRSTHYIQQARDGIRPPKPYLNLPAEWSTTALLTFLYGIDLAEISRPQRIQARHKAAADDDAEDYEPDPHLPTVAALIDNALYDRNVLSIITSYLQGDDNFGHSQVRQPMLVYAPSVGDLDQDTHIDVLDPGNEMVW